MPKREIRSWDEYFEDHISWRTPFNPYVDKERRITMPTMPSYPLYEGDDMGTLLASMIVAAVRSLFEKELPIAHYFIEEENQPQVISVTFNVLDRQDVKPILEQAADDAGMEEFIRDLKTKYSDVADDVEDLVRGAVLGFKYEDNEGNVWQ